MVYLGNRKVNIEQLLMMFIALIVPVSAGYGLLLLRDKSRRKRVEQRYLELIKNRSPMSDDEFRRICEENGVSFHDNFAVMLRRAVSIILDLRADIIYGSDMIVGDLWVHCRRPSFLRDLHSELSTLVSAKTREKDFLKMFGKDIAVVDLVERCATHFGVPRQSPSKGDQHD